MISQRSPELGHPPTSKEQEQNQGPALAGKGGEEWGVFSLEGRPWPEDCAGKSWEEELAASPGPSSP